MPSYLGQIARSNRIDDDGTRTKGSPINNADLQATYDAIEGAIFSGNFPNVAVRSLLDMVMAGIPFNAGGTDAVGEAAVAYPAGATLDLLAPNSRPIVLDSAHVFYGQYKFEAVLNTNNAAYEARLALFNLTDAPNTVMMEILSTSLTGQLVQSGVLVWPAPGAAKTYGFKLRTTNAAGLAKAWGIRLIRVS